MAHFDWGLRSLCGGITALQLFIVVLIDIGTTIFQKPPKPPLILTRFYLHQMIEIAFAYKRDVDHVPSAQEVADIHDLRKQCDKASVTLDYIHRALVERLELMKLREKQHP